MHCNRHIAVRSNDTNTAKLDVTRLEVGTVSSLVGVVSGTAIKMARSLDQPFRGIVFMPGIILRCDALDTPQSVSGNIWTVEP